MVVFHNTFFARDRGTVTAEPFNSRDTINRVFDKTTLNVISFQVDLRVLIGREKVVEKMYINVCPVKIRFDTDRFTTNYV